MIRQFLQVFLTVTRATIREPGTVLAMMLRHWAGDHEEAAKLAARVREVGS